MAHIILIHGFNVKDGGRGTIDTMAEPLVAMGHSVDKDTADYGWHWLFKVRFNHKKDVKRIAGALLHADVAYTHSNGGNYFNEACGLLHQEHPEKKLKVVHFSPAIDRDAEIPACVTKMVIFSTPHDDAVKWAKMLLFHSWGDAGRVGYTGSDKRGSTKRRSAVKAHSDWFKHPSRYAGQAAKAIGL